MTLKTLANPLFDEYGTAVLMPVTSLPVRDGIGDFGPSAHSFLDWLSTTGLGFWIILPIRQLARQQHVEALNTP